MKKLIVFIPALNEAATISQVIKQIPKKIKSYSVTVLVVDDGSTDDTVAVATQSGAQIVSHTANLGVGKAFQTGLDQALEQHADILVNIDADGQFDPKQIPLLIQPIVDNEADFVASDRFTDRQTGLRRKPDNMPTIKYYGNFLMAKLISFLAGQTFNDVSCGFRAYNRHTILTLNLTGKFTYTQESFLDLATKDIRITSIPVDVKYFPERKSRVAHNLFAFAFKTLNIILRSFRDYKPLIFFTYLSLIPFLVGLGSGTFVLFYYLNNQQFTPYKALGIFSIYLLTFAILLIIVGFLADMFVRLRLNQEKLLYYQKLLYYDKKVQ